MRRLGAVVRVVAGKLVVRCPAETTPTIGETAVDEDLATAGRVVDVFGPVDRPYAVVAAEREARATLLGARLYVR